jgi:hypothetical protein
MFADGHYKLLLLCLCIRIHIQEEGHSYALPKNAIGAGLNGNAAPSIQKGQVMNSMYVCKPPMYLGSCKDVHMPVSVHELRAFRRDR